jgi:hypothetical protein
MLQVSKKIRVSKNQRYCDYHNNKKTCHMQKNRSKIWRSQNLRFRAKFNRTVKLDSI